ncbi:MAG: threonylcarbamoyl-AMP synthase [Desulfobacterales bacterium]|nr:MAG: threonylcarbamoyl-AMP synthase [Desulfobacterales bacterium]
MPESPKNLRVNPVHPAPHIIHKAGKILTDNGIVIFPAQCLYGMAANALNPVAVEKVFQIKQRSADNPVLILIKTPKILPSLVKQIPDPARQLMNRFWPGKLTLIFEAADHISPRLTAGTGKIGVRLPGHPVARALVNALDFPITGTSANISGDPGCTRTQDLAPAIMSQADLILDAGLLQGGKGSSIVDVTVSPPIVLRQGAVSSLALFNTIQ